MTRLIKIINDKFIRLFANKYQCADCDFHGSTDYWLKRYENGKRSGNGSYGELGAFKARILNSFVESENVSEVIKFGCCDGNQLSMANYINYIGFDISPFV